MKNNKIPLKLLFLLLTVFVFFSFPRFSSGEDKEVLIIFNVELKGIAPKPVQPEVLTDAITAEFAKAGNFSIVDRGTIYYYFKQIQEKTKKSCDDVECLTDLAAQLDAGFYIVTEVNKSGDKCSISSKLYKRKPGTLLYFVEQTETNDSPCKAEDLKKSAGLMGMRLSGLEVVKGEKTTSSPLSPGKDLELKKPIDEGYGTLVLDTNPEECQIYIDSEGYGVTPQTIQKVPAGDRTIVLAKDGFSTTTEVIRMLKGQRVVLNKNLAPQMGSIKISLLSPVFSPQEKQKPQIYLDGKYKGVLAAENPFEIKGILVGAHTVKIEHPDYQTKEEEIVVRNNSTEEMSVELAGKPGKILVVSTPLKAKVSVDGVEGGETPYSASLPPGKHKIIVVLSGYKSQEKEIEINPNKSLSLNFGLEALPKGQVDVGEGLAPSRDMILIPAGEFMMGCNSAVDNQCGNNEKPYHRISLDSYYIDKYELTVDQYAQCVQAGKCSNPGTGQYCNWGNSGRGNHPVNCVDWDQADSYCGWAGKRLPTEAEWEKAARGTDGRKYPWGNQTATCDYAVMSQGGNGCGCDSTWSVGSKTAGASLYGVMDMAGNVWEWVQDWYEGGYYKNSPAQNPQGPSSGRYRVLRGGSWDFTNYLRVANRSHNLPSLRLNGYGFRCVRPAK
ncbi:MAG: formylglycine-generating enzyme family protein [Proteobacteria bacterium]|nr:formylglycine-generating enzyme family protein [Pseudomonadota bacterium]